MEKLLLKNFALSKLKITLDSYYEYVRVFENLIRKILQDNSVVITITQITISNNVIIVETKLQNFNKVWSRNFSFTEDSLQLV